MPLWSLSEEKAEELNRQLHDKTDDHDKLEATHIHTLWEKDLDSFLEILAVHEEKEELDRQANGGVKNDGKKGGRRRAKAAAGPPARKAKAADEEYQPKQAAKKIIAAKPKDAISRIMAGNKQESTQGAGPAPPRKKPEEVKKPAVPV